MGEIGRLRHPLKRHMWSISLVSLVSMLLVFAYVYASNYYATCSVFSSKGCKVFSNLTPLSPPPARQLTDRELASHVVIRDILYTPRIQPRRPKLAFMFLTHGPLHFEKLWDIFFKGHQDKFSIYVHASSGKPAHTSRYFINSEIRSGEVGWGEISIVNAERRLLANALQETDNQHFLLLSESCVPLHDFTYVYNYIMHSNISYVESFVDPGPHGNGRYPDQMLPEIENKDFRKGSQWFTLKRQHALIAIADSLYYSKFRDYCKRGGRNCYSHEHYFPTLFHMIDPAGISNWSVTHVDWSEGKWHPKEYHARDVTPQLLKNIASMETVVHVTSGTEKQTQKRQCVHGGIIRPCFLFAMKFCPDALNNLFNLSYNQVVLHKV